jgi:hypothetical protein
VSLAALAVLAAPTNAVPIPIARAKIGIAIIIPPFNQG